jgi:hypothetical protein
VECERFSALGALPSGRMNKAASFMGCLEVAPPPIS